MDNYASNVQCLIKHQFTSVGDIQKLFFKWSITKYINKTDLMSYVGLFLSEIKLYRTLKLGECTSEYLQTNKH